MPSPKGVRLDEGQGTIILFGDITTLSIWEVDTQPPGIDGGEPVDTTTHRNTTWRTFNPRTLKTMTPANVTGAYDPHYLAEILQQVNVNQQITVTFRSGAAIQFWGYLRSFTPDAVVEGQQPRASIVLQPTNQNKSHVETGPTVTGTTSTTASTTTTLP